jgi:hypothetical protein
VDRGELGGGDGVELRSLVLVLVVLVLVVLRTRVRSVRSELELASWPDPIRADIRMS